VYAGQLGDFSSHAALFCTTGGATSRTLAFSTGSSYYLVVPRTDALEGSYGRASDGLERPPATSACSPQEISSCQ
jgi:hypothetical protein